MQEALNGHGGTIGVAIARLDGTASVAINADRRFRTASLYKLFILATAMAGIDSGSLDSGEILTVSPALVAADPFSDYLSGTRVTVDCALRTMVEMSGNSAADLLEERLGLAAINAQIRTLGLQQSSLTQAGASTSAADMAQLLAAIGKGEAVSAAASQRMLELLGDQQQNDRLPLPLPLDVRVAHKTGELPGLRHDVGLVLAPSGAYVIAALVQDAPDEAEARSTIVSLSRATYNALEPSGSPLYLGLPPRLAREVFRTPDTQGRMALLSDPRTETVPLDAAGLDLADDAEHVRLRPEAVPDLRSLQQAAGAAAAPLWVRTGFLRPTEAEAARALPMSWLQPCELTQPERTADLRVKDVPPTGVQHWLGTVVKISDRQVGEPSQLEDATTPVGRWLMEHAWEYGFVPSLPEAASATGRERWTWRWLGREMAARLRPAIGSPDYAPRAHAELRRADSELASQDPRSKQPPPWGLDQCWTVPTASGQGCASRWNFLPLPGF